MMGEYQLPLRRVFHSLNMNQRGRFSGPNKTTLDLGALFLFFFLCHIK
jgi:hypothetical protein